MAILIDTSISTLDVDEPVLELGNAEKYNFCKKGEFAFVPTEKALIAILENAGFVDILKIVPPANSPFLGGSPAPRYRCYYAAFVE